jgi:alpha-mannosidase/mannosylglycerate hydrolase
VAAPVTVPAFGYTTLTVLPADGPSRYSGSLAVSHRIIENEFLQVEAAPNGTLTLTDKRSGKRYDGLLTFEDRADIGDGWFHGMAVNDRIHLSAADAADISLVADGSQRATLRITVAMNVPEEFDFRNMMRSARTTPLLISSDITLRKGSERVEVVTTVENTVRDHRVRVLFPTGLTGDTYLSDAAYNVIRRPVALAPDNDKRIELDVETRPQISWTAFGERGAGLAVVSRGLPESAVLNTPEHPIALTLFRGFRRAVFSNDNPGGQILGTHTFRYWIVPYSGAVPAAKLCRLGQRVNAPARMTDLMPYEYSTPEGGKLPPEGSFLQVSGNPVVTSVQKTEKGLLVRFFNPGETGERVTVKPGFPLSAARSVTLDNRTDTRSAVSLRGETAEVTVPGKRIATVILER